MEQIALLDQKLARLEQDICDLQLLVKELTQINSKLTERLLVTEYALNRMKEDAEGLSEDHAKLESLFEEKMKEQMNFQNKLLFTAAGGSIATLVALIIKQVFGA